MRCWLRRWISQKSLLRVCASAVKIISLARLQIERLRPFLALAHLKLDLLAFAELLEIDLRGHPGAMEEHLVAAVVGHDEPESLVAHDAFDGAEHMLLLQAAAPRRRPRRRRRAGPPAACAPS